MTRLFRLMLLAFIETLRGRWRRGPLRPRWSFLFEMVVAFLRRDWLELRHWPATRVRADLDARSYPKGTLKKVSRRREVVGGVPGEWFLPVGSGASTSTSAAAGPGGAAVLVYLHGGSYRFGSLTTHGDLVARMALACGLPTFAPEYRLAPEHPYPAPIDDALAVLRALRSRSGDPRRVVVAGESAGGHLALSVGLALRDAGEALPAASVLISPWLDLESSSASAVANARFDYGDREMLVMQAREFAGALPLSDPRISPLHARLEGLGPLLVQAGEAELLFDENRELAGRARAAGVEVTLDVLPDMPHAAPLLAEISPEGRAAIERAGQFIKARLSG